jgi:hypothetical protein
MDFLNQLKPLPLVILWRFCGDFVAENPIKDRQLLCLGFKKLLQEMKK